LVAGEPEVNPTVARRELAVYFRRLREQRGRTSTQLGELLGVAQSQASRLDSGARGLRVEDVERLCDWYGLGQGERRRLLALAEDARRRAWWQQVDLPNSYRTLIGFEQAAESISEFCNVVIPGLLQTERYAAAAVEMGEVGVKSFMVKHAVEVRMRRQQILRRKRPPALAVVIDESVLARGPADEDIMREQLRHLLELSQRPHVVVQVIGFEAGLYPTASAQFILLDMGSRLPAVYYTENQLDSWDSSDEADIGWTARSWQSLQARALDPARSVDRIERYLERLAAGGESVQ
jgi:transcriptional regulator with XRE-family HTH domain